MPCDCSYRRKPGSPHGNSGLVSVSYHQLSGSLSSASTIRLIEPSSFAISVASVSYASSSTLAEMASTSESRVGSVDCVVCIRGIVTCLDVSVNCLETERFVPCRFAVSRRGACLLA